MSARQTVSEPRDFELSYNEHTGFACFRDGRVQLLRFRYSWAWEYHWIEQRGGSRGLAIFVRYLDAAEAERIDLALHTELARRRLDARGLDVATFLGIRSWHVDVCTCRVIA